MFTIWVILCLCGIFKICKKKNAYAFDAMFFTIMFFPHCSFFLRNDLHYKPVPHLSMFFFFQAPLQSDQPLSGKCTRLPHEKTLLGAKQDPTEGATKIKPIFCYTVHFYTLRLIFPREAKEKESARGTMGRRKVIASSYWDTQQEPALMRENHPCGTFLDCYDF